MIDAPILKNSFYANGNACVVNVDLTAFVPTDFKNPSIYDNVLRKIYFRYRSGVIAVLSLKRVWVVDFFEGVSSLLFLPDSQRRDALTNVCTYGFILTGQ